MAASAGSGKPGLKDGRHARLVEHHHLRAAGQGLVQEAMHHAEVHEHGADGDVEGGGGRHALAHEGEPERDGPGGLPLDRALPARGHLGEGTKAGEGLVVEVGVEGGERIDAAEVDEQPPVAGGVDAADADEDLSEHALVGRAARQGRHEGQLRAEGERQLGGRPRVLVRQAPDARRDPGREENLHGMPLVHSSVFHGSVFHWSDVHCLHCCLLAPLGLPGLGKAELTWPRRTVPPGPMVSGSALVVPGWPAGTALGKS